MNHAIDFYTNLDGHYFGAHNGCENFPWQFNEDVLIFNSMIMEFKFVTIVGQDNDLVLSRTRRVEHYVCYKII